MGNGNGEAVRDPAVLDMGDCVEPTFMVGDCGDGKGV